MEIDEVLLPAGTGDLLLFLVLVWLFCKVYTIVDRWAELRRYKKACRQIIAEYKEQQK